MRSALQAVFTQTLSKLAGLVGSAVTMAICRDLHPTYLRQGWQQQLSKGPAALLIVFDDFVNSIFPSQRLQKFTFSLLCPKPTVYKIYKSLRFWVAYKMHKTLCFIVFCDFVNAIFPSSVYKNLQSLHFSLLRPESRA